MRYERKPFIRNFSPSISRILLDEIMFECKDLGGVKEIHKNRPFSTHTEQPFWDGFIHSKRTWPFRNMHEFVEFPFFSIYTALGSLLRYVVCCIITTIYYGWITMFSCIVYDLHNLRYVPDTPVVLKISGKTQYHTG